MNRIPEPELMNGQEQALAYASADFSAGDQALIDRVQALFPAGLGECIADLGCGPGNISFRSRGTSQMLMWWGTTERR